MDVEVYDESQSGVVIGAGLELTEEDKNNIVASVIQKRYGLVDKDNIPKPDERQQNAVIKWVLEKYDILRINYSCRYYYKPKYNESNVYSPVSTREDRELREMVKEGYKVLNVPMTATKIKNTVETLKESIEMEQESIDPSLIEFNKGWYWDAAASKITKEPNRPCFIKLFDNSGHDTSGKIVIDTSQIIPPIVKRICDSTLELLEANDGVLPLPDDPSEVDFLDGLPYFDFIDTWACGNEGVYNDILKAASAVFMKKKPVGAFILTGLRRNGKSTFVKMLHTMLGRANTSSVRLAELHDPHKNLTLLGTLLNAPDEEIEGKDMSEEATADFKSMAAHEELVLPVMYSAQPQPISTDFVMFCPMNDDPEWKGNSASACAQRSLIIPFYADLSKFDNSGRDFEKETFTPVMYQNLLGVLFAYATYYSEHKLTFSSTMESERKAVSETSDNRVTFANLFCKWFVGYTNETLVFDEYKSWCDRYNYNYVGKRKLMFAIDKVAHGRTRTNVVIPGTNKPQPATRLGGKPGNNFFAEELEIKALKRTVGGIVYVEKLYGQGEKSRSGQSVIATLEEWQASKMMKRSDEE